MLRKRLLIIFLLSFSVGLGADETEKDLREICDKISQHSIARMDFAQSKFVQKLGRSFNASGILIFDQDKGMAWNTLTPSRSSTILLADRMVRIGSNGKRSEVKVGNNDLFLRFSQAIQTVFAGDIESIKRLFKVSISWKQSVWSIGLEPLDKDVKSVIKHIQIVGTDYIDHVVLTEETGDTIRYSFTNITFPARLNDAEAQYFL